MDLAPTPAPGATTPKPPATPAASDAATPESGGRPTISSDFETFLKMLTVQMENQDPLNPVDSADYAVQLATFSNVEQNVRTNDLLTALDRRLGVMGISELAGWVGMQARVEAPAQFDGQPITLYPDPSGSADSARLMVRDAAGTLVQSADIPVSDAPVAWAGVGDGGQPLLAGLYSFEVESYAGGELQEITPVAHYATVREARMHDGEVNLVLDGGAEVAASSVSALRGDT